MAKFEKGNKVIYERKLYTVVQTPGDNADIVMLDPGGSEPYTWAHCKLVKVPSKKQAVKIMLEQEQG